MNAVLKSGDRRSFLSRGQGKRILNRCGLDLSFLIFTRRQNRLHIIHFYAGRKETKYFIWRSDYEGIGIYENFS